MTPIVQFQQVSKNFRLNLLRPRSFLEAWVRRSRSARYEDFEALRDVSFDITPGETVGLIGPNGSGKSTVLKLISRIIDPTRGKVITRGRIASLLELGAGFHPDLSGRENIYLNASILGIPRRVIRQRTEEIVDFAQIGSFIDVPVRNYSSGMAMRLGFSITTALDPDILLIDEILAVGDHSFQRKCLDRLEALRAKGVTTVFVSHSLEQVQRLCRRAIWLHKGQIRADGDAETVIGMYLDAEDAATGIRRHIPKVAIGETGVNRWGNFLAEITSVELLDREGRPKQIFQSGEFFRLRLHYQTRIPIERPSFGMACYRSDGVHINGPNTQMAGLDIPIIEGCGHVDYVVEQLPLAAGRYELTVSIHSDDFSVTHDHHHRLYPFEVQDRRVSPEGGIVHLPAVWQHVPDRR